MCPHFISHNYYHYFSLFLFAPFFLFLLSFFLDIVLESLLRIMNFISPNNFDYISSIYEDDYNKIFLNSRQAIWHYLSFQYKIYVAPTMFRKCMFTLSFNRRVFICYALPFASSLHKPLITWLIIADVANVWLHMTRTLVFKSFYVKLSVLWNIITFNFF